MSIFTDKEKARNFLELAGVFYDTRQEHEEWNKEYPSGHKYHEDSDRNTRTLNMNDTFAWALAYGEEVSDEEMTEVAGLFWRYGHCGLTYWCAEKDGWERSEFEDVTRGIDFVRHEEKLRKEVDGSSQRAYTKLKYTLGKTSLKQRIREIKRRLFWKKVAARKFIQGFNRGIRHGSSNQ